MHGFGRGFMHGFMGRFRHRFVPGFDFRFGHRLMPEGTQVTLVQMQSGQKGTVVEIAGGRRIISRLSALEIRPGRRITKLGSMLMRGPVTIKVGRAQVAIGFGMARRIIIEVD